jgi:hypothetical protein
MKPDNGLLRLTESMREPDQRKLNMAPDQVSRPLTDAEIDCVAGGLFIEPGLSEAAVQRLLHQLYLPRRE